MSEPRGPVYLTLPREWLCQEMQTTEVAPGIGAATKIQAETAALEQIADILCASERPLIITKYLGRNPQAVAQLVELADLLAIPVAQILNYVNFPTDHPLHVGTQPLKYAKDADVVFLIDVDVPWEHGGRNPLRANARVLHLDRDPLFTSVPVWGFSADLAVSGCSEIALPVLNSLVRARLDRGGVPRSRLDERRKRFEGEHQSMMREQQGAIDRSGNDKPINPIWVSKCIGDALDDNTIIANETITSRLAEVIPLNRPGSLFGTPLAGHLGWGLGAAIGMKLGRPDATVIAAEGDGSYMFSAPTACHFTAQKYGIPFLTVVYNNQAWNATIGAARGLYPNGAAQTRRNFPGTDLSPSPHFEMTAQACGAHAVRVEEPEELPDALQVALKVVREERRQALVNVVCRNPLA
jgi:acetolactate synthase-1/2/3 large subunit